MRSFQSKAVFMFYCTVNFLIFSKQNSFREQYICVDVNAIAAKGISYDVTVRYTAANLCTESMTFRKLDRLIGNLNNFRTDGDIRSLCLHARQLLGLRYRQDVIISDH